MRGRTTAVLVMVLVAIAGVLGGIALDRAVLLPRAFAVRHEAVRGMPGHRTPGREGGFRQRFARELELTPVQRRVIDSLMDHQLRELRVVRSETQPRMESVIRRTRRAIDSVLTPEQREKAAELAERRRHRMHGQR